MEDSLVFSSAIIKSSFRLAFLYWRNNILFSLSSQNTSRRAEQACYVAACHVWRTLRTAQRCSPHSLLSHRRILSVASPWCTRSQVLSASTAVAIPQKLKCREPLQGDKKKLKSCQSKWYHNSDRNCSSPLITLIKSPDPTYSRAGLKELGHQSLTSSFIYPPRAMTLEWTYWDICLNHSDPALVFSEQHQPNSR